MSTPLLVLLSVSITVGWLTVGTIICIAIDHLHRATSRVADHPLIGDMTDLFIIGLLIALWPFTLVWFILKLAFVKDPTDGGIW